MGKKEKERAAVYKRCNTLYAGFLKKLIYLILKYPKLSILLPIVLTFALSYDVTYDYGIKQMNNCLASRFVDDELYVEPAEYQANKLSEFKALERFSRIDVLNSSTNRILIKLEIEKKKQIVDRNVLDYEFFKEVNDIQMHLQLIYPNIVIISPLTAWPFDLDFPEEPTDRAKKNFGNNVRHYVNSDIDDAALSVFVDDVRKVNHLILLCETLKLYIFPQKNTGIQENVNELVLNSKVLSLKKTSVIHDVSLEREFLNYYLLLYHTETISRKFLVIKALIGIKLMFFAAMMLYIYISIANQRRVRSVLGLLIGWTVEIIVSTNLSINFLELVYGKTIWSSSTAPLQFLTRATLLCSIMIFSSRNLFILLDELTGSEFITNSYEQLPKRMFRLYLGLEGEKAQRILSKETRSISKLGSRFFILPTITKSLIYDVITFCILSCNFLFIIASYQTSIIIKYFATRLQWFVQAIIIGVTVDHLLQLSYLVGILVFDLNRYELADLLNFQLQKSEDLSLESFESFKGINGPNFISKFLLNLPPLDLNDGLPISNWRHRFGRFLLTVDYATLFSSYSLFLYTFLGIEYAFLLYINWFIFFNTTEAISRLKLGIFRVITDRYDSIYYLEYTCVFTLIIALSLIAFKVTKTPNTSKELWKLTDSDFVLEDEKKALRCIDFIDKENGYQLDVIDLISNETSPYFISVGLDHKVLMWSPLGDTSKATNLSTTINTDKKETEFWPIDHIDISNGGHYFILINYKSNTMKCFERRKQAYIWEKKITLGHDKNEAKLMESFFRERTVPGYLKRKMLQKTLKKRRPSEVSLSSLGSKFNGNFRLFDNKANGPYTENGNTTETDMKLDKLDYIMVFDSGEFVFVDCETGDMKSSNALESVYNENDRSLKKFSSVKKLITPRVNDRVVCHVNNFDIIVAHSINNSWRFQLLHVTESSFDTPQFTSLIMLESQSFSSTSRKLEDFMPEAGLSRYTNSDIKINKSIIVTIDFVGMIVRVNNLLAEFIDIQSGVVLRRFNVSSFKPLSLKVTHLAPIHCKFCGCASVSSLSVAYEDSESNTIIVHTFMIKTKRSRNNICLRVERDPREIRCLGLDFAVEEQSWFENIECWQLTELNMIIGVKKREAYEVPTEAVFEPAKTSAFKRNGSINALIQDGGLQSLKSRFTPSVHKSKNTEIVQSETSISAKWEGFVASLSNGKLISYEIPNTQADLLMRNTICCSAKFGFKAILVGFGNLIKLLYLGSEKLIETDLYSNVGPILSQFVSLQMSTSPSNNSLLFVKRKRRDEIST